VWPFVAVVGTAMFAAGVWVAAGGRGSGFDRQEELYGGLFFGAVGLLCLLVALASWETGRPQLRPRLVGVTLAVDGETFGRGDGLTVTLTDTRKRGDPLEVGLACDERVDTEARVFVRGASVVRRQTGEETIHEQWQPASPGVGEQSFTLRVPEDAPYSYEGACVSWGWRVSARAARRLRKDARADSPIWVEP
jgi:hypothetical protein